MPQIKVKPITDEKTTLNKMFDEFFKKTLPIHHWEREQKIKRQNIKI